MAAFDTGYVNVSFYGVSYGIRVAGNADRSDGSTSVRFYGNMYDRQNSGYWASDPHYSSIGELIGNGQIKPSGTGSNGQTWTRWFDNTLGIGIGTTSRGFTANFNGAGSSYNIGFTAWFNDGYSAPTGLNVTSPTATHNTVSANVSVSGWGHNSGSTKYLELTASKVDGSTANRRYQGVGTNNLSAVITVNNSSAQTGSMTVDPNTRYYLGGYASNGNRSAGVWFYTNVVTLADGTYSIGTIKPSKITFAVTGRSGHYAPTLSFRYRKVGDTTWTNAPESIIGTSGTLTLENLSPSTNYEMQQAVTTGAGTWYSNTFTVKTKPASIIIFPDNSKLNVSFRLIYPDGRKRDIERWKKISPDPGQVQYQGKDVRYSNKDVWYN